MNCNCVKMELDISGVRISPSTIEFRDTEPEIVHQVEITIKNISNPSKHIRIYPPRLKKFRLKSKNNDRQVASGLSLIGLLEYVTDKDEEFSDVMIVTVNSEVIEIPINVTPARPFLQVEKGVNFGNVGNNADLIHKTIHVVNHGAKPGHFEVTYGGDKPIRVFPKSGVIQPRSVEYLMVEFITKYPGRLMETICIKALDQEPMTFTVKANVVPKCLRLIDPEYEEVVDCVKFGPAYYGTDRTECIVLYNDGPDSANFVVVLDDSTPAQIAGEDLTKSTAALLAGQADVVRYKKGMLNILTSVVTAIPNQGFLRPYEKILLLLRFSPRWNVLTKGWQTDDTKPPRKDFALFLRFKMIGASRGFQQSDFADGLLNYN